MADDYVEPDLFDDDAEAFELDRIAEDAHLEMAYEDRFALEDYHEEY